MLRSAVLLAVAMGLAAPSVWAADYKCAKKETNVALNDHDLGIAERESSIKEMKTESLTAAARPTTRRRCSSRWRTRSPR